MYVLLLVTYPRCNEGTPCREVQGMFHDFEHMVDFTDHWMGRLVMEDRSREDDCAPPAWDYAWHEEHNSRVNA